MSSAELPDYVSMQDYLMAEESARIKTEYVDGWVRAMTGATNRHNRVKLNCLVILANALNGHTCQPFDSDTKLKIDRDHRKRFYYPDAQVVCRSTDPQCVYQEEPVLVIEVLSPSTRRYDLEEKKDAYLSVPSLECYVVLEQHQPIAIVMRRTADGFTREVLQGTDQSIDLAFLSCSLSLQDIYKGVEFTETCVQEPDPEYCQL